MTLATHLVVGAAGARLFAGTGSMSMLTAFLIGWMSHYILDSITHWDYPPSSYFSDVNNPKDTTLRVGRGMIYDILKVSTDAFAGFILVYFFIRDPSVASALNPIILLGAIGGGFPDFIQFAYSFLKWKPFELMQRFHHFMHSKSTFLEKRPAMGIAIQVTAIIVIILLAI